MPQPVPLSLYLHQRVSLGFVLLLETTFEAANRLSGKRIFDVDLVADRPGPYRFKHGLSLARVSQRLPGDGYLVVPPLEAIEGELEIFDRESVFLQSAHARGLIVATACLGALLPAAAGLLDGREATLHWRWGDYARKHFPNVRWNPRAFLCSDSQFITAGGLLATVDLALHIVSQHCSRKLCRELGRHLLADSVRQNQSLYAASLTLEPRDKRQFEALEAALESRLATPPSIPEMAELCNMSLRTFHRAFADNYGVPPGKFLQLKRIARAKELLTDKRLGMDEVAARCGFRQTPFFRSIFARETGVTPAQFRKRLS